MTKTHGKARGLGRLTAAGSVLLLLGVSIVGCGEDGPSERNYALPENLCGLEVPRRLYAPLFPPGEAPRSEPFTEMPYLASLDRCLVSRDGEPVIAVDTFGTSSLQSFLFSIGDQELVDEYDDANAIPVPGEFEAMVWPGFVLAGTSCEPGTAVHSFTIGIRAEYPEDDEESVRALSQLIQPFMEAAIEQSVCTPGENPNSDYRPSGN